MTRVLAIDPGYDRVGTAVLEGNGSSPLLIWSDCLVSKREEQEKRLAFVEHEVARLLSEYTPDYVALETLFFNKNAKTAIRVAEARGVILAAAGTKRIPVLEYSPQHIKLAVTGNGRADKQAVARILPRLLSLPPKKRLDDEVDAIALGIAALSHIR